MIRHINKIKLVTFIFFSLINISCKNNLGENGKTEKINFPTENVNLKMSEIPIIKDETNSDKDNYVFYNAYFQSGGETDLPEISEEEVIRKFKIMKILLSKNTIFLNSSESSFTIDNKDSKKFFGKKYIYDYNVNLYKNIFSIDLSKIVSYLNLDVENNDVSPFKDYFLEAGDAIYMNNCIFLNYKRYVICFKKDDKNKIWDKKYCELPFDYERLYRSCQRDSREGYSQLCNNEYPIFYFKNDNSLKSLINEKIKNKKLLFYYNLKTNLNNIRTIVAVCEHEEESFGDQYIINLKNNNTVSILNDEKNDFFHSMNFVIDKNLDIIFYENNGIHPKEKIVNTYKINSEGDFIKIK